MWCDERSTFNLSKWCRRSGCDAKLGSRTVLAALCTSIVTITKRLTSPHLQPATITHLCSSPTARRNLCRQLQVQALRPLHQPHSVASMAEKELQQTIQQLHSLSSHNLNNASPLLSRAKLSLLKLNALVPTPQTSPQHLQLAREVLELGALISIRQKDPEAFTRYFQQLQSFYSLPAERWGGQDKGGNKSKVTGLHMLLLLSQGDYASFHTVIESLEMAHGGQKKLDDDAFIQYPMRLEQALMEGSYDRVWGETKGERVPSEEFTVFSEVSYLWWYCYNVNEFKANAPEGPRHYYPFRNRLLQRTRLPLPTHLERQEPALPGLRRRSHSIRPVSRLGSQRGSHLLPPASRGDGRGPEGHPRRKWPGHREYAGIRQKTGDNRVRGQQMAVVYRWTWIRRA